jgi:hypothetical protein
MVEEQAKLEGDVIKAVSKLCSYMLQAVSSTLKIEAKCSSEKSADWQKRELFLEANVTQ